MTEMQFDVVVVGSGAAGMTTALRTAIAGKKTLVLESAAEFGGTTAVSGGRVWIPNNGSSENVEDSPEAAKTYLRKVYGEGRSQFIDGYVDNGPRMQEFIEQHSVHRFKVCPNYPDYHQEHEGATTGGRCLDMEILWHENILPEAREVREAPSYLPITHAEWEKWRYPQDTDTDLLHDRYQRGGRTGGNALSSALMDGGLRAGVEFRAQTTVTGVVQDAGRVTGVIVDTPSGGEVIHAEAIVIAAGGFDHDPELRARHLPDGLAATAAAPANTGIGVRIAEQLNLPTANMSEGWWMPMVQVPGETVGGVEYPRGLVRERGVPRAILVNSAGKRFINEASPYNEFGRHMHVKNEDGKSPNKVAYLVFDEGFRQRYPIPGLPRTGHAPEHVLEADSLSELGQQINVPSNNLEASVQRWNELCRTGKDVDFQRGDDVYDRYYGDPWQEGNPTMGPINQPPYYAVRVLSGSVGTKGGLVTRPDGKVVGPDRKSSIPGLYAVGNSASAWTQGGYPGPGATLGLGMIFGMLAGEAIATQN